MALPRPLTEKTPVKTTPLRNVPKCGANLRTTPEEVSRIPGKK